MRYHFFYILTILLILSGCTIFKTTPPKSNTVKILSYNVRNARGMDDVTDFDRVANVIRRINADCVALQELDSATQRSNGLVVIEELAKRTGMHASYNKSIDYQGGGYGIGILTKEKPLRKEAIPLPGSEEQRSLLVVEMPDYVICCTHWSLRQPDRLASVEKINGFLRNYASKPVFLAGDLNALPESGEMQKLTETWTVLNDIHQHTIPVVNPSRTIDYVLIMKNPSIAFQILETKVENEPLASDHLPVWATVQIKK